jgi:hypothetical protein
VTQIPRETHHTNALSVITIEQTEVITKLVIQFGINFVNAFDLALRKSESARIQIEAWSFREAKSRNRAGWMIQASKTTTRRLSHFASTNRMGNAACAK